MHLRLVAGADCPDGDGDFDPSRRLPDAGGQIGVPRLMQMCNASGVLDSRCAKSADWERGDDGKALFWRKWAGSNMLVYATRLSWPMLRTQYFKCLSNSSTEIYFASEIANEEHLLLIEMLAGLRPKQRAPPSNSAGCCVAQRQVSRRYTARAPRYVISFKLKVAVIGVRFNYVANVTSSSGENDNSLDKNPNRNVCVRAPGACCTTAGRTADLPLMVRRAWNRLRSARSCSPYDRSVD